MLRTGNKSLAAIKREITRHKKSLNALHAKRQAMSGYTIVPVAGTRRHKAGVRRADKKIDSEETI